MRPDISSWRVVPALAGCCCWLGLLACQSPGSQRIIGPDGSAMAHVHCGSEQGVCFRLAGELCPAGYDIKPVLSGSDGNFLVRCRVATAVAAACPTPSRSAIAGVTFAAGPNKDAWPPNAEPSPAPYPWPAAETNAAGRAQPTTSTAQGDIDIGY